jgi:hypothetical protein
MVVSAARRPRRSMAYIAVAIARWPGKPRLSARGLQDAALALNGCAGTGSNVGWSCACRALCDCRVRACRPYGPSEHRAADLDGCSRRTGCDRRPAEQELDVIEALGTEIVGSKWTDRSGTRRSCRWSGERSGRCMHVRRVASRRSSALCARNGRSTAGVVSRSSRVAWQP